MRAVAWLVCAVATALLCSGVARLDPEPPPHAGPWRLALARLRANPAATAALYFLIALYVIALLAPWLVPYDPNAQLDIIALRNQPPSLQHPFGTDFAGRDVFSRTLFGARISLSVALLAVLVSTIVGTAYGAAAGYYGGRLDNVMMRGIDAALSMPRILLLIAILALWDSVTLPALVLLLGLTGWFAASRLVRAQVLSLKEQEMVLAARAHGAPDREIIWHHILPNVLSPVIVAATLGIGNIIIIEAGLSYLGVGVRPPTASWGNIIQDGGDQVVTLWWMTLFPGFAIVLTVMAFNLLGDGLRDALDPRQLPRE